MVCVDCTGNICRCRHYNAEFTFASIHIQGLMAQYHACTVMLAHTTMCVCLTHFALLKHILADHIAGFHVQDVAEAKIIEAHASEERQQPQVGTG